MPEEINNDRRRFLGITLMTIAASQLGIVGCGTRETGSAVLQLPVEGELPSLGSVTEWLNSHPLKTENLRGKVVLINFCTYTCINWLRQLPYVRAWNEKYKDQGLVVIGVHTPEFVFEKNLDNVRRAIKNMKVDYPVAIDNDYALWNAFKNQY